ncbi:MAG: polyphosphate kinase 1 [Bacteroidota bacterium]
MALTKTRVSKQIRESNYISRDLSWLQFNYRVLDQAKHEDRTVFEKLKFMAITASNLDEFFMIRVGSLYNYLDYNKEREDYSGLREVTFRKLLLAEIGKFFEAQHDHFVRKLKPLFAADDFKIVTYKSLGVGNRKTVDAYFRGTIYPMLTPMVYDNYHTFPVLTNNTLIFGVTTKNYGETLEHRKISFIQIPRNLPRFFEIEKGDDILFVPIEQIIRNNIGHLFRNVEVLSVDLMRVTRNGDFTLEESEDIEANFLEELKSKLKTRKTGRVVRIETDGEPDEWMINLLKSRWEIDDDNIFRVRRGSLIDFKGLWQIVGHPEFQDRKTKNPPPVKPMNYPKHGADDIFELLNDRDIILHHPYNSIDPLLELLEKSSEDPNVLSIKLTIYRLAKDSRVTTALLKAAENGKHVSVLFEVKARFDEENNLLEAQRLQKAGCFVIYGVSNLKTHTKLLLIVRKEGKRITRYVHMSSGNYNEDTSRLYTDIGLLTTNEVYAHDVSEFFNVITGHSQPEAYVNLITAPKDMRKKLIKLIRNEADNASKGLPSGIVVKINSLQDKEFIDELYKASEAGVPVKLIVRGICCLRPGRKKLSDNIEVYSIVGEYLEHSRIYYFHNADSPRVCVGSADAMVRSFDRRIESLFFVEEEILKKQVINILLYNLKDNVNTYVMQENGQYKKYQPEDEAPFNVHKEFYKIKKDKVKKVKLFS